MTAEDGNSETANGSESDKPPKEPVVVSSTADVNEKISRVLYTWFFSYEPSYFPLLLLWALGAVWAVFEIVRAFPKLIKPAEAGVLAPSLPIIIGLQLLLGLFHQLIVFRCIHVFDSERAVWSPRFPNFLGTRLEWVLRVLILVSLLGAGGEVPLLIKHIRDSWEGHLHEVPPFTYPLCSVLLYTLLVTWDVAGAFRRPDPRRRYEKFKHLFWHGWPPGLQHVYFYSDLLCLIFWAGLLSWAAQERIGAGGLLAVLLSTAAFTFVTIFRIISHVRSQRH
jgi:hypothetical protein